MKIPCLPIHQSGEEGKFWICKVKVKELLGKARVDQNSPENPEGYQREVVKSRARKFGEYMKEGNISPISLLVNIRTEKGLIEKDGYLDIPEDLDWWIVDGQHRFEGLKIIIEEEKEYSLRELELPIILMNVDKTNEAKQFLIINKRHKGVRTDLAERILYILQKKEGKEKTKDLPVDFWKPEALVVVDKLTDIKESPLYGMIKRPGEKGNRPLKQVSVTDSLGPVISTYKGYLKNEEKLARALMNMWSALKDVCSDCFVKPKDYLLLKTMGVYVMHKLFAELLPTLAAAQDLTKEMFLKLFSHPDVKKYFSPQYWHRDTTDGISIYGSSAKSVQLVTDLIWSSMKNVLEELAPKTYEVKI